MFYRQIIYYMVYTYYVCIFNYETLLLDFQRVEEIIVLH